MVHPTEQGRFEVEYQTCMMHSKNALFPAECTALEASSAIAWLDSNKSANRFITALCVWANGSRLLKDARDLRDAQNASNTNAAILKEKIPLFENAIQGISAENAMTADSLKLWVNNYQTHLKALDGIFQSATDAFKSEVAVGRKEIWRLATEARDKWGPPFKFKLTELIGNVWLPRCTAMVVADLPATDATRIGNGFKTDHDMLMWMVEAHDGFLSLELSLGYDWGDKIREDVAFSTEVAMLGSKLAFLRLNTGEGYVTALKDVADCVKLVQLAHSSFVAARVQRARSACAAQAQLERSSACIPVAVCVPAAG